MTSRLLTLLLFAAPAAAQCDGLRLIRSKQHYGDEFGTAMDIDGGRLAVGTPGVDHPVQGGHVYVYDLATREKLHRIQSSFAKLKLGTALDLDGDSLVVGGPGASWNPEGRVFVFDLSNAPYEMTTDDAILTIDGPGSGDRFGTSVALDGNLLLVGAVAGDVAYVYDWTTGQLLHEFSPADQYSQFGHSVALEGNLAAVGAPNEDTAAHIAGSVFVFDVVTGQQLYWLLPPKPWFQADFGFDLDLDGGRLLVGDPGWTRPTYLFEAATGALLMEFRGTEDSEDFGWSVSLDGDRAMVGEPGFFEGSVYVFDTDTGARLAKYTPESLATYANPGEEVVLREGWSAVGAPTDRVNGSNSAGSVWISRAADVSGQVYCSPAEPNSTGVPARLRAEACGGLDNGHLGLGGADLPLNQFGYFLTSPAQAFVIGPGGSAGNLCLGSPIGRFIGFVAKPDELGRMALQVDVTALPLAPPHAIRPGETWNFQLWYRDLNPTATSNFTNAVSVTFPPDVH
ncbi:MAG: hypothetical protein O2816_17595 [Planctomycetota bacterium]|nr:hypothetical protein [Planctomycetota bacterium]